jgi:hypothetical protein
MYRCWKNPGKQSEQEVAVVVGTGWNFPPGQIMQIGLLVGFVRSANLPAGQHPLAHRAFLVGGGLSVGGDG